MKPHSRLLTCLLALLLPALAVAQVTPDKAIATMKVADDLQIELFAAEPMLINPTSIDVDHKGRVWVCEAVNYRRINFNRPILRPEGDRIVVLEDTTGTGKADKSHVFYQGKEIIAPLGVAVAPYPDGKGQRVFVCQSPDILVFEDKEGRLKADGPPKKFLSGFGGFDHDHGVHGIFIGPDGKLWFTVGDTGVHGLQSSDGKGRKWNSNDTDCRAGTVWRCDIDGRNLELIAHNFRNNYQACVDSFGTVFLSDNDDDGNQQTRICFVMPGGDYGYHPRGPGQTHWHEEQPGVVPKILRTGFGSPTGIRVYEGDLLPKRFKGELIHADAGPREFRAFHLTPNGAGYDCAKEILVTSSDTWFRLSDVCVAPDGSVFLADWYDPGVGGHGMGDWTRGRIYRVTPKGHKGYKVPEVKLDTREGILAALGSPCRATMALAIAKLHRMKPEEAIEILKPSAPPADNAVLHARIVRQVSTILPSEDWRSDVIDLYRSNPDERLRQLAIRIIQDHFTPENPDWPKITSGLVAVINQEPSAALRREFALLIRNGPADLVKPAFYALAEKYDGKDRFYLNTLGIAAGKEPTRRAALLADFGKHFPDLDDKTLDLVFELRPPGTAALIEKNLGDDKQPAVRRARMVDILAAADDKDAGLLVVRLLRTPLLPEVRERVLANLRLYLPGKWQALRLSSELTQTISDLLRPDGDHTTALLLIAASGRVDLVGRVEPRPWAANEPLPNRRVAIETLGKLPGKEAVAALERLDTVEPAALRADAVRSLALHLGGKADQPDATLALTALQKRVLDKQAAADLRQAALEAIAGTRPGASWLLDANGKGEFPDELKGEAGRLLRNSPYPDLRNKAVIAFPTSPRLDLKKLPPIPVLAARKGDVARGKAVLANSVTANTQCLKCHMVQGVGGQIGPDLSLIGKKASRENLYESLLIPSKAIADQYIQWQIETKKGVTLLGLVVEETPESVLLRDANGKDTRVARKDIETRTRSPLSIMPEDICSHLSEQELTDLVEYMLTLKTAVLGLDYWHIVGPFDNGTDDKGLDEVFPPEKTVDLQGKYDGKTGKVAWRTVRPDLKGYVDLRALYGDQGDDIVSYLYREIESPVDQEATIMLGHDDGCKLWINGKQVYLSRDHVAARPDQARVSVKLTKGVNRILFKINNGQGEHGFYFTVLTEEELKRLTSK